MLARAAGGGVRHGGRAQTGVEMAQEVRGARLAEVSIRGAAVGPSSDSRYANTRVIFSQLTTTHTLILLIAHGVRLDSLLTKYLSSTSPKIRYEGNMAEYSWLATNHRHKKEMKIYPKLGVQSRLEVPCKSILLPFHPNFRFLGL